MNKQRILFALKGLIILLLLICISMLIILRWKSDFIVKKVLDAVQHELVDSLQYTTADMNWFSHFPLMSVQIYDLSVGSGKSRLIQHSDVDLVIGLLPLLKNEIVINQLVIREGILSISNHDGKWSYDIKKKKETADGNEESFNTRIRQLLLENVQLQYNDGHSTQLHTNIQKGVFKGSIADGVLESDIHLESSIELLSLSKESISVPLISTIDGRYTVNLKSGEQHFKNITIDHEAIQLAINGNIQSDTVDISLQWEKGDPAQMQKWLPEKLVKQIETYSLTGITAGEGYIKGPVHTFSQLKVTTSIRLEKGAIVIPGTGEKLSDLELELTYADGTKEHSLPSGLHATLRKKGAFTARLDMKNIKSKAVDFFLDGTLSASLLNAVNVPGLSFKNGTFQVDNLQLRQIKSSDQLAKTLFSQEVRQIGIRDLHVLFEENDIHIHHGTVSLADKEMRLTVDQLAWNKVSTSGLEASFTEKEKDIEFTFSGNLCDGTVASKGSISGLNKNPVIHTSWTFSKIEISKLLSSFSNFDQTFITDKNLSGQTNLWAESVLPFDKKWNLLTKQVHIKSAIEIHDGRLRDMQTLEDFGKFVHLEDLQDIRFSQLRNYMLIEKGKIFLPVMFIQSSALNLSISGEHGFDDKIIYYLKVNAGQVAANKLKKNNDQHSIVKARKSGWINMYFALSGTTQNVQYQQYKNAVIAGFEQSVKIKESLRDDLVNTFGYDVYWLEPNEWEDIPEYE